MTHNECVKEELQRSLQLLWLLLDAELFLVAQPPPVFLSHNIEVFLSK